MNPLTKIKLNAKYKPLFINDTRFFVITGGRGSSKSFGVGTFASGLSFETGHKILFTRQTMTSAHMSIIPEFQEKINLLEASDQFEITKQEIVNKQSGSVIIFKGIKTSSGDQTAALKSLQGVTTWILDEAEELTDEKTFDKINLSIRQKGKQNRVILILNPTTKESWIYRRFFEEAGVQPGFNGVKGNATYIHTDYRDNLKHLDDSFVQEVEQLKETNPKKYQHVILGGWLDKADGVIFTNWKLGEFVDTGYTTYGSDFGFSVDPTTLVKTSVDKKNKRIYIKPLLYQPRLTTSQVAEVMLRECKGGLIYGDSAEPRLIEELQKMGVNILPTIKGAGSVTAGIALIQDYEMIIDDSDPEMTAPLVKELNNYVWHDKKANIPVDAWNHYCDSVRYACTPLLQPVRELDFGW